MWTLAKLAISIGLIAALPTILYGIMQPDDSSSEMVVILILLFLAVSLSIPLFYWVF